MATFSRQATLTWEGDVNAGAGRVNAGSGAFAAGATFPRLTGDPAGTTTPEELLAASHATCFGIGVRSLIARRGGTARRVTVTATITADKGPQGVRIKASHLSGRVEGLEGLDHAALKDVAREAEGLCTISIALRGNVTTTSAVTAD